MAMRGIALLTALSLLIVGQAVVADGAPQNALDKSPKWVPGEVIVGFTRSPGKLERARIDGIVGATGQWRALGTCGAPNAKVRANHPLRCVRVITLGAGIDSDEAASAIAELPGVAYAHPNYMTHPAYTPNDTYFISRQYALNMIRAEEAWDHTIGDRYIVVAVADSGINFSHEEFQNGKFWSNADPGNGADDDANGYVDDDRGWDFIHNDNDPSDTSGHGTHIAGIIGAEIDNARGIAGVADVTIMPLKVFEGQDGTWGAIAEAIVYAVDNGAGVINYSGGGFGGDGLLAQAVAYAYSHHVPVIAASGNHGSNTPFYPAAYSEVIAVSATGVNDVHYSPSGQGDYLDVAAPGLTIWSTAWTGPTTYEFRSGTSMATAHVSGLVALMVSLNPDLAVEEIRTLLRENAVDIGDPGFDEKFGWGRIDAAATLDAVPYDDASPYIVHDGAGARPFSGYIDPRGESTDGLAQNLGLQTVTIEFSEPVRDLDADTLSAASFSVITTGEFAPEVLSVDATQNPLVTLQLSAPLPVGAWTTIVADVGDFSGNRIETVGDLGAFEDEPDRVDIGFLPGDVDQSGGVSPFDLLQYRQLVLGQLEPTAGVVEDFVDTDRDGDVDPFDLLLYRQLIHGTDQATRPWAGEILPQRP